MCGRTRKLCRSHIFSQFLHERNYDETGTAMSISSNLRHSPRRVQTGWWEHLLCEECETRISKLEAYGRKFLDRTLAIDVPPHSDATEIQVITVRYDYRRFKLFALSLLWRAHVAKSELFRKFSIGPLAEDVRRMLLAEDAGPRHQCPFLVVRLDGAPTASTAISTPQVHKVDGIRMAQFYAYGFWWVCFTTRDIRRGHVNRVPFGDLIAMSRPGNRLLVPVISTTERQFQSIIAGWINEEVLRKARESHRTK